MWLPFFITCVLATTQVIAGVHEVWWNITYVEGVNPDGLAERRAIGVNGTWPPPPIEVSTNDSLVVHATNSLPLLTSLHHHGMFFNSSSWMDGAVGVTECGIPPGRTFDYVVPINSSGQWGTYWVHAHASGQYVDGLRAPVVIHPTKEVHTYDEEFTVVLSDWYHTEHSVLLKDFISIKNPGGAEPVPDSALIYFAQNASYLPPVGGTSPAIGFNENATLPFTPGKTYRLRVVNTSAFSMFYFWIDGHQMRIIEVDGTDIEESPVDMLSVTVAQRYSVLVTARNDSSANWAIHANMDVDMFDTVPPALNPNATSSVSYSSSATTTNSGFVDEYKMVKDISLVPVQKIAAPAVTKTIELEVIFDTMDDGTNRAMFNQITYNQPNTPAIFSALTLGDDATVERAYGPLSFVVSHMEVVDLVVKNGDAGKHPFHLHGHKPMLVNRADDYTSTNVTLNPPVPNNLTNPMRRDTFHIPSGASATLRFVSDNPGVWFFHCHIEWHLEAGLALQIVEAPLEAQKYVNNVPQTMRDNCQALGRPSSGNAAGHQGVEDLSGLRLGPYPQKLGWRPKGIGAMFGCVLTAVLGMATVTWYSIGGGISDEEMEREERERLDAKAQKGRLFGVLRSAKDD
ncbi:multicopper oxidase [Moniliophthora roreri MCA 2997]|uniref:Multicopper oxidase n=1 Tax=Moniliophthora roreri (strain MCA 2997) TaxID=1381753 RepID=V2XAU5_MONRO|nr:multicopper oxidase [Moniliophthora roreri MCA 2997]